MNHLDFEMTNLPITFEDVTLNEIMNSDIHQLLSDFNQDPQPGENLELELRPYSDKIQEVKAPNDIEQNDKKDANAMRTLLRKIKRELRKEFFSNSSVNYHKISYSDFIHRIKLFIK